MEDASYLKKEAESDEKAGAINTDANSGTEQ